VKRILLVDDESRVLEGIQQTLHADPDSWDVLLVPGADPALKALEHSSFDIVVSDMRVPGRGGASLLTEIQGRFPDMTRIALSETTLSSQSASVAHRVLSRTCNASELREIIERVIVLRDLVASPELRAVVGKVKALPSLSTTYLSLTEVMRKSGTSVGQVAAIIERDVAMAAKVLQLTNSAFFGLSQRVASLSSAVNLLGIETIRNLALASEAFRAFKPNPRIPVAVCQSIQDHAVKVAAIVGTLPVPRRMRDVAVVAGLLHDIGKLLLVSTLHEEYFAATARTKASGCRWFEAEQEILGTTHAEIGAYLLGLWGIPELAVEAIAHHHCPNRIAHSDFDCTTAVYVADLLAHESNPGSTEVHGGEIGERDRILLEQLGLSARLAEFRACAREL
jgi:HD-like signal output (HDOD) protein